MKADGRVPKMKMHKHTLLTIVILSIVVVWWINYTEIIGPPYITIARKNSNHITYSFEWEDDNYFLSEYILDDITEIKIIRIVEDIEDLGQGEQSVLARYSYSFKQGWGVASFSERADENTIIHITENWNPRKTLHYGYLKNTYIIELDLATKEITNNFRLERNEIALTVHDGTLYTFQRGTFYSRDLNNPNEKMALEHTGVSRIALAFFGPKDICFIITDDGITYSVRGINGELRY